MSSFHHAVRLALIYAAEALIRWSNWHFARSGRDLPWKVPEPGFHERTSAQVAFALMDGTPGEKRTYQ